jgi:hypothetical protein
LKSATGFVAWVVLSLIIASNAKKRGRSYVGFLLLSIFLSPIVGFIILRLRGKNYSKIYLKNGNYAVYVTRSGSKYHSNRGCPALRSAKMIGELTFEDAVNSGLTACEKCI